MSHAQLSFGLLVCCLFSVSQLLGCGSRQVPSLASGRTPPASLNRANSSTLPSFADADIASVVKSRLTDDPGVDARDIHATVTQGIVELTGTAPNLLTKRRAVRVAEAIKGVRAVSDRLELRMESRPDEEIAKDVASALRFDPVARGYAVSVNVREGRVVLEGNLESYGAGQQVVRLAESISGVRAVDDRTVVRRPVQREDSAITADVKSRLHWDVEIAAAIRDAAAYDPRASAADLHVSVTAGFAQLTGTVRSLAARQAVRDLAEHTVGVLAVSNELSVEPFESITDDALAERVQNALRWDPYTEKRRIAARTWRGKVTLWGDVRTAFERAQADPEQVDLAACAKLLAQSCGVMVAGPVVGRTGFRDALAVHLGCSQLQAEQLVDTLVARGFLSKRLLPDGRMGWAVSV